MFAARNPRRAELDEQVRDCGQVEPVQGRWQHAISKHSARARSNRDKNAMLAFILGGVKSRLIP